MQFSLRRISFQEIRLRLSFLFLILLGSSIPVVAEQCGRQAGGAVCAGSQCCSQFGYCGNTADYCGIGCQSGSACYGSSPDIVVTGGYYPVVWTGNLPSWWPTWESIISALNNSTPGQIFDEYWKDKLSLVTVATLDNPARSIKIGPTLLTHIKPHVFSATTNENNKSVFSQKYSSPIALVGLMAYGVTQGTPKSIGANLVVYETSFIEAVGQSRGSTYMSTTNIYSIVAYNTGVIENGKTVFYISNMFPGTYP